MRAGARQRAVLATTLFLACLGRAVPALAAEGAFLPPFTARYTLNMGALKIGETRVTLSTPGAGRYFYQSFTRPAGFMAWFKRGGIIEQSAGTYAGAGLRPRVYFYRRTAGGDDRNVSVAFDWAHRSVTNTLDGRSWHMAIPPGTVDKLITQIALMLDLRKRRGSLSLPVADGGTLKTYRYSVEGEKRVTTPAGTFYALKVKRVRNPDQRATYFWCAPGLDYLPVRVDQLEKGSLFHMVLDSIEGLPARHAPR
ncbi:MAG: DUF3108 domain-containing protein [Gammaproteobacteria bacterium]|nr:DUF3108 domain-containing protein [Gammaproteobacteria bacterium]